MSKIGSKRSLRDALAAAARTFSGDYGIMLDLGTSDHTDCGKAIVIRDPELLMKSGLDEDLAVTTAKVSTTHESGHIRFGTDIVKFNDAIIKLVMRGADREIAFRAVNYAEDCRIDAAMGRERPGYKDQRISAARAFMPILYHRTGSEQLDMHLDVIAKYHGVDLHWTFTPDQEERIKRAVELYRICQDATSTEEAAAIGVKVYVALYGEPTPCRSEPELELKPGLEPLPVESFRDEDDLEDIDFGDADEDDEVAEDEVEEASDESEDKAAKSILDSSVPDTPERDALERWLDSKKAEVMSGDSLAEGISDSEAARKRSHDRLLARGSEKLAKKQAEEQCRPGSERLPICDEIESMFSQGVDAGVKLWYESKAAIDLLARMNLHMARKPHLIAPVADLTQVFKDMLRKARERDKFLHTSGRIRADKAWRGTAMGDTRLFIRHSEKGAGGYAVKLLLDASGSMSGNESKAADVAYIVTKALIQSGMNVCVEAFDAGTASCCVYHSIFVPWNSADAERVFAYRAREQNRDNFSLKAAAYELSLRQEAHKIMIVISDGAPYHGGESEAIQLAGGIPGGGGKELIDDAAQAVRTARTRGIKVLGIYFGNGGRTANTEAYIYGKDFIHVTDLSRIVPSIRTYLGRILSGT